MKPVRAKCPAFRFLLFFLFVVSLHYTCFPAVVGTKKSHLFSIQDKHRFWPCCRCLPFTVEGLELTWSSCMFLSYMNILVWKKKRAWQNLGGTYNAEKKNRLKSSALKKWSQPSLNFTMHFANSLKCEFFLSKIHLPFLLTMGRQLSISRDLPVQVFVFFSYPGRQLQTNMPDCGRQVAGMWHERVPCAHSARKRELVKAKCSDGREERNRKINRAHMLKHTNKQTNTHHSPHFKCSICVPATCTGEEHTAVAFLKEGERWCKTCRHSQNWGTQLQGLLLSSLTWQKQKDKSFSCHLGNKDFVTVISTHYDKESVNSWRAKRAFVMYSMSWCLLTSFAWSSVASQHHFVSTRCQGEPEIGKNVGTNSFGYSALNKFSLIFLRPGIGRVSHDLVIVDDRQGKKAFREFYCEKKLPLPGHPRPCETRLWSTFSPVTGNFTGASASTGVGASVCVHARAWVWVCACMRVCVCVCHNEKKCQTNGKHDKRHRRYFK